MYLINSQRVQSIMNMVLEISSLKKWWSNLWMDPTTKYLSQSVDHMDLEQRIKRLQRKGIWL
jgi:hypothetical protein